MQQPDGTFVEVDRGDELVAKFRERGIDALVVVGHYIDGGGNNLWGVQVFQHDGQEYVAASDRDSGLYIFRYTGTP